MNGPVEAEDVFARSGSGLGAGFVYAAGSRGVGVPDVFDRDLDKAFGVSMSTIYKRAWVVKRLLGLCPGL